MKMKTKIRGLVLVCFGIVSGSMFGCSNGGSRERVEDRSPDFTGYWSSKVLAGTGERGWRDGDASQAKFNQPYSVTVDSSGNVYIADTGNGRIRKIDAKAQVSTLAAFDATGDTGCPASKLPSPTALAYDTTGNQLYFTNGEEVMVLRFNPCSLDSVAKLGSSTPSYDAQGLVVGKKGELYFTKALRNQVFVVRGKDVTQFSGTGQAGRSDSAAWYDFPAGLAIDSKGDLILADFNNAVLRKIDASSGQVQTYGRVIWYGRYFYTYPLYIGSPTGVAFDSSDKLYVATLGSDEIRRIGADEVSWKLWGTALERSDRSLKAKGLAVDASGENLYIANPNNNKIYKATQYYGLTVGNN